MTLQQASKVEEFQEVTEGQEKGMGFSEALLCFSFKINKTETKQKAPQTQTTIPGNTLVPRSQTHSVATTWGMGSSSSSKLCRIQ